MEQLIPSLPNDVGLECLARVPHTSFSSSSSVCRSWKLLMELPDFWRHRKSAGLTQQLILMAQARVDHTHKPESVKHSATPFYRLTLLEPETGSWAELPQMVPDNALPLFCQLVGVGSNLVVMGGLDCATWQVSNAVFVYNFVSATWKRGAEIPCCRRSFFACASDSDRMVFVAGGHDDQKNALRSALVYDVAKDEWSTLPDMATERDECRGVFHGGKFHVIGGYQTHMQGRFETSAEAFDVAKWGWDTVEDGFLASAMIPRTCISCENKSKFYIIQDGYVVSLEGCRWQIVAELPADVRNTSCVTAWKNKLLVIGSPRSSEPHRCYVLDLTSHTWTRIFAEKNFTGHVQSGCCIEI